MLKPQRMEVDCVFQCDDCDCETWYTVKELKQRRFLDCPCGKRTRLKPVKQVYVIFQDEHDPYGSDGAETAPKASPTHNLPIDDFVQTLVGLGHDTKKAKKLVLSCADQYTGDEGSFLNILLASG